MMSKNAEDIVDDYVDEGKIDVTDRASYRAPNPDEVERVAEINTDVVNNLRNYADKAEKGLYVGTAGVATSLAPVPPESALLTIAPAAGGLASAKASRILKQRANKIEENFCTEPNVLSYEEDPATLDESGSFYDRLIMPEEFPEAGITVFEDFEINRPGKLPHIRPERVENRGSNYKGNVGQEDLEEMLSEFKFDQPGHLAYYENSSVSDSGNQSTEIITDQGNPVLGITYDVMPYRPEISLEASESEMSELEGSRNI